MLEIRQYKFEDALAFSPAEIGLKNHADYEKWAKMNQAEGPAKTMLVAGEIVACGGIRIFWQGVGEAWALISDKADVKPILLCKMFAKELDTIVDEHKLRWIQAIIRVDFSKGIRFMQYLGFERKCTMQGYAPDGSDCFLYSLKR